LSEEVDAIIIGAGVIGASIAFELCKRGYRTLNIDKLPAAGYGPTSNSCSIVRAHYSSREGVAMAYEGFFYWQDWPQYVGDDDESGLARYMQSGTVLLGSGTGHHEKVLRHYRDLGVEHELWDNAELRRRIPIYDTGAFWPPKRPSDPHFWDQPPAPRLLARSPCALPGIRPPPTDPSLRSSPRAARMARARGHALPRRDRLRNVPHGSAARVSR